MTTERLRADARACFAAAVAAVEPGAAIGRWLARDGAALVLADATGVGRARHHGPVVLVGAGKAVAGMAGAARAILGPSLAGGVVIAPHGSPAADLGPVRMRFGAHPVSDQAGVAATRELVAAVRSADRATLVLVLLSGGASALLSAPADDVTLEDKRAVTRALLAAGAEIGALNAFRKHCSDVKGGRLARAAAGAAACWTLVLSDVVGDDLATIASGPTVADPSTYADAVAALARYAVTAPPRIAARLARGAAGAIPETPKAGDPALDAVRTRVVGRNGDAVAAAAAEARRRGYRVTVWPAPLQGDAADLGAALARAAAALPSGEPVALVAGGETTVRARPGGLGGRSQHLGVAAALALAGQPIVLLAAGTDGIDGPTEAAGACVDGETVARARRAGIEPSAVLAATDSHRLLAATGDLVVTGPTGTNVADIVVALRGTA
jgi:glycerate-2-kinase